MPWMSGLKDNLKKSACIYLMEHYLGCFIKNQITKDQVFLDMYNGTGSIENVMLDVKAINEVGKKQNWPIEVVSGHVGKISLFVPWSALLSESTSVEFHGTIFTVRPTEKKFENATSMFESMLSSMTTSMQLAQECKMNDPKNVDYTNSLESIDVFINMFDYILALIKVKFVNTVFQLEYAPVNSLRGIGIVINVARMEYADDASNDTATKEASNSEQKKGYSTATFSTKNFIFEGVSLSTLEFRTDSPTFTQNEKHVCDDEKLAERMASSSLNEKDFVDTNRHVIPFAKFEGRQEIRLRMKESDDVDGPKLSINVTFGGLSLFVSPRQVYLLAELINGISSSNAPHASSFDAIQNNVEKPMTNLDFKRVEEDLQHQIHPSSTFQAPGLQGIKGWSSGNQDESDNDDNFLPMHPSSSGMMYESFTSNYSSSMESSLNSSIASSMSEATTNRSRRRTNNLAFDPTAQISTFQIKLASIALVVLHEDLITLSSDGTLLESSVRQMQKVSNNFLMKASLISLMSCRTSDCHETATAFNNACDLNQLRFLAAPIQIESNKTTTSSEFSFAGKVTIAKIELSECLKQDDKVEHIKILSFSEETSAGKPSFKLNFKHSQKTLKMGLAKRLFIPKTEVNISLDPCTLEIDITLMDRITALLHPPTVCHIPKQKEQCGKRKTTLEELSTVTTTTESQLDIKLSSDKLTIKLRFPIPDFRGPNDRQKMPWWRRNVRASFLTMELTKFSANTSVHTNQICKKYAMQAKMIDINYHEKENVIPLHIAKVTVDERIASMQDGFNFPRFVVMVYPVVKTETVFEDEPEVDPMSQSCYGSLFAEPSTKGPFSCKRVIHESDTPHTKKEESAEMVIPGDKHEMSDFIESATRSSRIQLEMSLPTVSFNLVSKHIYEVLYNHLSSDLLLWEPAAPAPAPTLPSETNIHYPPMNFGVQEAFAICKSEMKYHSDTESSDGDNEEGTVFHSVYTDKTNQIQQTKKKEGQSNLTLNLHIGQGLVCMSPPVRDTAGNVIPEQNGEFVMAFDDVCIFSVTGYKGDENLGYVCIQSKCAKLHHCDMIASPSFTPPLRDISSTTPRHLQQTIYKSEPGMLVASRDRGGDREMLSVAVKIEASHETHHVKTVCVAVGINKATLRHRMCSEPNSWISQLVDFFNVNDYTIPGYHAKDVLTELHLHLWDCAIDYRPFNLPLRSVVTMGTFSMSSHLSAVANTSTLRFIAEECVLFLSEKDPPRKGNPSNSHVDLMNDYVAVVDLGLFELSLRTNDKENDLNPHFDLRASNNIINIRTCVDSGRALMQLITYIANDGDLPEVITPTSTYTSPRHNTEPELVNIEPQRLSEVSNSERQEITQMMGEAMEEIVTVEVEGRHDYDTPGAQIFFFPDEKSTPTAYHLKSSGHVLSELGDVSDRLNRSSDTDDDFCMIGDESGFPTNSVPIIKWLTDESIRIIDNHFQVPLEKADVLRPAKSFPIAVERYTLCDMSLMWQMYGGNDFSDGKKTEKKEKKTVNFQETAVNYPIEGIVFDNFKNNKNIPVEKVNWIVKGGVNRDHDTVIEVQLNKVRFQHEVYPEHTLQVSRQLLFVGEYEVRDRLSISGINKFLYQHSDNDMPKQSHANMLGVRALHIRPDRNVRMQECSLLISMQPLRIHIDQDTLLFFIEFCSNLCAPSIKKEEVVSSSKNTTPTHRPPLLTVSPQDRRDSVDTNRKRVDENLMLLLDEACFSDNPGDEMKFANTSPPIKQKVAPPIYFRRVVFTQDVYIRLDYHGKRFDMSHGPVAGMLMCLAQLNKSQLKLKRFKNYHGLLGVNKLVAFCLREWLNDIKKNQLPGLLGGVGPMRSFIQFFQGVKDLIWMPIEQYQKDGRIVRGLQRGANSFTTSTAMAALELTSRIIQLIQLTAETAYDMMSPGPSVRKAIKPKGRKKRYNQPQDIREGVANAYTVVRKGLGETAENIVRVASLEREQKGYSGAVGGVLRQLPPTLVKPIILATEATSNVLGGVQNQLLPDARREAAQKWKMDD